MSNNKNSKTKSANKRPNRYRSIADVVIKESTVGAEALAQYKMIDDSDESADTSKS